MKKFLCVILAAVLSLGIFAGCGSSSDNGKLKVVTTVFPEYDWVLNVLGDKKDGADVTFLLDNGVDLHSFQPTAADMVKISSCDVFIYVGGESDKWVEDALKEKHNDKMITLNLLDLLGEKAKAEEEVEGMQEDDEEEAEEETEYDEHIWLSLKNAEIFVNEIANAFAKADSKNADTYKNNAAAYNQKLDALDKEYETAVNSAKRKTLLFADRFPFLYLTKDYGLSYYAAFKGCSAESEASFETVAFLAKKVDELSLTSVLTLDGGDKKIADTVIKNTQNKNAQILELNSMQSENKKGDTYINIMERNLDVLKTALN